MSRYHSSKTLIFPLENGEFRRTTENEFACSSMQYLREEIQQTINPYFVKCGTVKTHVPVSGR